MPGATSFSEKGGDPPVYQAFAEGPKSTSPRLIGYLFETSDLPPEEFGYSGTIKVLIGMDLEGDLTGISVIEYHEALVRSRGDFLRRTGVQEQFAGKSIADPFRVYGDIDGITRATVTVRAMARGVRNSARRVAMAYLREPAPTVLTASNGGGLTAAALEQLTWLDMVSGGLIGKMQVVRNNALGLDLSFVYVGNEKLGDIVAGADSYASMIEKVGPRYEDYQVMILGLDGGSLSGFRPTALTVSQGGNSYPSAPDQVVYWGRPNEGTIAGQVYLSAIFLLDRAVDVSRPFTIRYDDGWSDPAAVEYSLSPDVVAFVGAGSAPLRTDDAIASSNGGAPAEGVTTTATASATTNTSANASARESIPNSGVTETDGSNGTNGEGVAPVESADAVASTVEASEALPAPATADPAQVAPVEAAPVFDFDFTEEDDQTAVSLMLEQTRWSRVVGLVIVVGLALNGFLSKGVKARWVALGATLVYLGWIDGGFLSISHITSGIAGGPGVYLGDLTMPIMILFTLVTTLLWGRVFCGFLCPFGALQDFIERVIPKRFRLKVPSRIHERALYIKYGILGLIVALALVQSDIALYGYFEPFGTVFFLSTSVLMWSIAGGILLASAVIPRFYCRYACPLGAALGVASLVSFFRIPRVEQCDLCKVCEQLCPTGAISGPDLDFKECVRCNICETKLLTKAGVCRHDMDDVQSRLVQLKSRRPVEALIRQA